MVDGRCVAVLEIASRPMNQFTDSDRALMATVAEQLAAALRGVQLRNQSELRAQRLALTASVANAVAAADTVEDVLRAAVDAIFEPTDYGAVTAILAVPGAGEHLVVTDRVRVGESVAGDAPADPCGRRRGRTRSAASRSSSGACPTPRPPTRPPPSSPTSRRS